MEKQYRTGWDDFGRQTLHRRLARRKRAPDSSALGQVVRRPPSAFSLPISGVLSSGTSAAIDRPVYVRRTKASHNPSRCWTGGRTVLLRLQYRGRTIVCDAGVHPAYSGIACLPFIDDLDWSTVDVLLITQCVPLSMLEMTTLNHL